MTDVLDVVEKQPKPKSFGALLKALEKRENYRTLVKTALTYGFLTDGEYLSRLKPEEEETLNVVKRAIKNFKSVEPLPDPAVNFPPIVGLPATKVEVEKDHCKVFDATGHVVLASRMLITLRKRHPRATIHFAPSERYSSPLYLSERSGIVAVCPLMPEKKEESTEEAAAEAVA